MRPSQRTKQSQRTKHPSFRRTVRVFLAQHDLRIQDMAEEFGITASHLSLLINGKRSPSLTLAIPLARRLGLTLDELVEQAGLEADKVS